MWVLNQCPSGYSNWNVDPQMLLFPGLWFSHAGQVESVELVVQPSQVWTLAKVLILRPYCRPSHHLVPPGTSGGWGQGGGVRGVGRLDNSWCGCGKKVSKGLERKKWEKENIFAIFFLLSRIGLRHWWVLNEDSTKLYCRLLCSALLNSVLDFSALLHSPLSLCGWNVSKGWKHIFKKKFGIQSFKRLTKYLFIFAPEIHLCTYSQLL